MAKDIHSSAPTPHNSAQVGEIAKTVIMPGDPLRAKFIAETFLTDVVCFNEVRGMLGYTGKYKGKEVSVMGHGMGIPSIGIYSFELYKYYGVESIIRVGSCGSFSPDVKVYDVILSTKAYSMSTYGVALNGDDSPVRYPSEDLNNTILESAKELGIEMVVGPTSSGDCFYGRAVENVKEHTPKFDIMECYGLEMEGFGLYANADVLGKKAACLLTCSDHAVNHVELSAEERQNSFTNMMKIALETAIKL